MENEKKKGKMGKRIAAVATSAILTFSQSGSSVINKTAQENPASPNYAEMNIGETLNFDSVAKHYPDFKNVGEEIISLKDLLSTPVGGEVCDTMVPQGLEIVDGMILVTAYDGIEGYKGELTLHSYRKEYREKLEKEANHMPHNSVIVVYDQKTKERLTTIELPDMNHVGGITSDGENVYIAKSIDEIISVISLDKIKRAVQLSKEEGIKTAKIYYDRNLDCKSDASFVTMRESEDGTNQLVVGTWNPLPNSSTIRIFDFTEVGDIKQNQMFYVDSSANGAAFIKRDGKEYLVLACSLGRILNSHLNVYEVDENEFGLIRLHAKTQLELPPMVEEVAEFKTEDGQRRLAIGTEAFTNRYKIGGRSFVPEGIMVTDLNSVIDSDNRPKQIKIPNLEDLMAPNEIEIEEDDKEKER